MDSITLGNNNYVAGLTWRLLEGVKPKSEAKLAAKENDKAFGITLSSTIEDEEGKEVNHFIGLTSDKDSLGKPSAAAVLSEVAQNVILIESIGANKFWVCAIVDGIVLPGGDEVVDRDSVIDSISEILSVITDVQDSVPVCSLDFTALELGVLEIESHSFEDIVGDFTLNKRVLVRSLLSESNNLLLGFSAVIALVVVSLLAYSFIDFSGSDSDLPPLKKIRKTKDDLKKKKPVDEKKPPVKKVPETTDVDILAKAKQEEIKWLREDFEFNDPAVLLSNAFELFSQIDRFGNGWKITEISLSAEEEGLFKVTWKRNVGDSKTLLAHIKSDPVEFLIDGVTANSFHSIEFGERVEIDNPIEFIRSSKIPRVELMDRLNAIQGANWRIDIPKQIPRKQPIEGLKDRSKEFEVQLKELIPLHLVVEGTGLSSIGDLSEALSAKNSVSIRKLVYSVSEKTWLFEGLYYEVK